MISYILNRQYKKITECLPQSLQVDQPETVYLPSYANPALKEATLMEMNSTGDLRKSNKLKIKKKAKVVQNTFLGDCCPTCFTPQNISVKYYSKKHICINCRKFLRDQYGNQVKLFVNKQGDIICLGIYKVNEEHSDQLTKRQTVQNQENKTHFYDKINNKKFNKKLDHKVYYHTDYMKLFFNGKSAFVTFAGEDQMVVLLRGQEN